MIIHIFGAMGPMTENPAHCRTAAIVAPAILEYALKKAICLHLKPEADDPEFNYLFQSDEAPYREFAGRIRLARALGVISRDEYERLEIIRHVRNAFAHSMSAISFKTEEVADFCDELGEPKADARAGFPINRHRFITAVLRLYVLLVHYAPPEPEPPPSSP
jgi:hypothetical protein